MSLGRDDVDAAARARRWRRWRAFEAKATRKQWRRELQRLVLKARAKQ